MHVLQAGKILFAHGKAITEQAFHITLTMQLGVARQKPSGRRVQLTASPSAKSVESFCSKKLGTQLSAPSCIC
jgi:hypothetical protein